MFMFTITLTSALFTALVMGLLLLGFTFVAEVKAVYDRVRWAINDELRHQITWKTVAWFPLRLYVLFLIPSIFITIFSQIFG